MTEYYDDSGVKRSPNASARALKQFAELEKEGFVPTKLFNTKPSGASSEKDFIDDVESVVTDATANVLDDVEITSQHALAEELELKDGPA